MKNLFKYFLVSLLVGGATLIYSCSDDDDTVTKWEKTYVTVYQADYLKPIPASFNLKHSEGSDVEGDVEFQCIAMASRPVEKDVVVDINVTCDAPISADKINVSNNSLLIKAGEQKSEPLTINITDWSELTSIKEAATYHLNVNLGDITSQDDNIEFGAFVRNFSFEISKPVEKPKTESLVRDPANWIFNWIDSDQYENLGSNSVDGTGWNDVATNGVPIIFSIDFKEVKELSGIRTSHWGASFAPTKIKLYTSANGTDWNLLMEKDTSGGSQTVKFDRIKTRYFKYEMVTVPSRVDIRYLYFYMWQ